MRRKLFPLLAAGALFLSSACSDDTTGPTGPIDPTDLEFAAALGVDLSQMTKTASGLYYQDLVVGTGAEAETGKTVTVHYTVWLHDGTKLDSSYDFDDPFTFLLGAGAVIAGWDEGIQGIKVGGKRKLVVPSSLAYGSQGSGGVIPPYATLVFDVDLLEVIDP